MFLIKPLWPNSQDENLNILKNKRAFKMKLKAFSLKQIKHIFWEGESLNLN